MEPLRDGQRRRLLPDPMRAGRRETGTCGVRSPGPARIGFLRMFVLGDQLAGYRLRRSVHWSGQRRFVDGCSASRAGEQISGWSSRGASFNWWMGPGCVVIPARYPLPEARRHLRANVVRPIRRQRQPADDALQNQHPLAINHQERCDGVAVRLLLLSVISATSSAPLSTRQSCWCPSATASRVGEDSVDGEERSIHV